MSDFFLIGHYIILVSILIIPTTFIIFLVLKFSSNSSKDKTETESAAEKFKKDDLWIKTYIMIGFGAIGSLIFFLLGFKLMGWSFIIAPLLWLIFLIIFRVLL